VEPYCPPALRAFVGGGFAVPVPLDMIILTLICGRASGRQWLSRYQDTQGWLICFCRGW